MNQAGVDMNDLQKRMDGAIASFKSDLSGLRTGRASASLVDTLNVDAYGSSMPLSQLATISVPEPRTISIQVWDKGTVIPVEKAIRESSLGLNPVVDGQIIRVPLPELNEERRKELVKVAHKYAEQAKVAVRHVRRDGMDNIKKSDAPEDEQHKTSEDIQKLTDDKVKEIDTILEQKESEITQI